MAKTFPRPGNPGDQAPTSAPDFLETYDKGVERFKGLPGGGRPVPPGDLTGPGRPGLRGVAHVHDGGGGGPSPAGALNLNGRPARGLTGRRSR